MLFSSVNAGLFTQNGEGFFLNSPSEYLRISVSARNVNKPSCVINVPDGCRPVLSVTSPGTKLDPPPAAPTVTIVVDEVPLVDG